MSKLSLTSPHPPNQNQNPASANPFNLPSDEEIFRLRDLERKSRLQTRVANSSLKIWEKNSSGGRNVVGLGGTDGEGGARSLRMKDLNDSNSNGKIKTSRNISTAIQPNNERRQDKEVMTEFIAKKREMFLVQMSLDTKREEIRKLEEKAQMKEEALRKSEQMLEEDAIRFDTFLKENDKKAHEAIKKAEKETKMKTDKVQEIKKLNQQIQMVQSDMSKHKEALEDCLKYKDFLDRLTPLEWFDEQVSEKKLRQEERRRKRIEKKVEAFEVLKEKIHDDTVAKHEAEQNATAGSSKEDKRRKRKMEREGPSTLTIIYPPTPDFDDEELTNSGTEMPMYFTHPQQLLDVFTALEEQNLFLIQNSQETEQALEDLKTSYRDTRKKMDDKTTNLEENIKELQVHIVGEEGKANQLAKRVALSAGDTQERQEALLRSLGDKVKDVYQRCGFDSSSNPSTLFMLSDLEAQLEDLLSALELMPEDYVKKVEKEKEKKRRELKRQEQQAAQEAAQEERNRKAIERSMQAPKKKTGRPVMFRSVIIKKKVKEDSNEVTEDDMDELKYLT